MRPVERFCNSAASLTRCASPPDSVGANADSYTGMFLSKLIAPPAVSGRAAKRPAKNGRPVARAANARR